MQKVTKYLPFVLLISLIVYFTIEAYATSTGRVLRTSTVDGGCGGSTCHGNSTSSNTSLSLVSGSLTVDPETTNSFTVRVSNNGKSHAGINIAAKTTITGSQNIGSFAAPTGSGLQVMVDELTHTTPKEMSGNNADFNFNWTAPQKPGTYYLRAVGNAVNLNGNADSGDEWNFMTPLELIVRGVELLEPAGNQNFCTGRDLIVKWESAGIANLKIELSSDGGATWPIVLSESFNAVGGNYIWSIPTGFQQGNRFRIRLSDVTNSARKSEMTSNFGIFGQFSITKHPESKEMCNGQSVTLYLNTTGQGLKYQWRKNGAALPGATDSTLVLNNVNSSNSGYYGVIVSSDCFSPIISNEANIQVRIPTTITKQPESVAVCPGDDASFQIIADAQAIKYQWYKGQIAIAGETSPTLTIEKVSDFHVGEYSCEVLGFCGNVRSNVVTLQLNTPPKITKQIGNQTVCEQKSAIFSIEASGLNNKFEWFLNDTKLTSESSSTLTINNVSLNNAGIYYCLVSNNCGEPVKSVEVELKVNPMPKITKQPESKTAMVGDMVELSVTATDALSYQWRKNNANIKDSVNSTISISSIELTDAGDYDCVVTNSCGNVNSSKAKITVTEPEPGARINFSSTNLDFGNVFEENSLDSIFANFISNIGNQDLIIDSIRISHPDTNTYFVLTFQDSTIVAPGEAISLQILFTPKIEGIKTANLQIYSNAIGDVPLVYLSGKGANFDVVSNKSRVDFGTINVDSSKTSVFRIFNQTDYDISWVANTFDCGTETNYFTLISPELPTLVKAKSSKDVEVEFAPKSSAEYECKMSFEFWNTEKNITVTLLADATSVSVDNENTNIYDFNVYPNPSSSDLIFDFSLAAIGEYSIEIIDYHGKSIKMLTAFATSNINQFRWDGCDNNGLALPSGNYLVIIKSGKSLMKQNIILVK